jgi:hypothetical protein
LPGGIAGSRPNTLTNESHICSGVITRNGLRLYHWVSFSLALRGLESVQEDFKTFS